MNDWNPVALKKAHVQAHLKFTNDSQENWVKVLGQGI